MPDYRTLIDAETWAFIERTNSFYPPDTVDFTIAEQRRVYDEMCREFFAGYPQGVSVETLAIAVDGRQIPIRRYRRAVTEIAGFSRTSGFIDDTRAFCSIPARHDMSRRVDAGWVAELVAEHRLEEDEAVEVMTDLVTGRPTAVFKL